MALPEIRANMVFAQRVIFLKPIFEDDFPEKGMSAWLVDVEWNENVQCYKLYFDFAEFEAENEKYFKAVYYPNRRTAELAESTGRTHGPDHWLQKNVAVALWDASEQSGRVTIQVDSDFLRATRRAIVRAAAEIGRNMK